MTNLSLYETCARNSHDILIIGSFPSNSCARNFEDHVLEIRAHTNLSMLCKKYMRDFYEFNFCCLDKLCLLYQEKKGIPARLNIILAECIVHR